MKKENEKKKEKEIEGEGRGDEKKKNTEPDAFPASSKIKALMMQGLIVYEPLSND
jgi:hypothetical protein